MKKCMMMATLTLMSVLAVAQETSAKISLADARGQIDKVIASADQMKATMKKLSAEDQKAFLAEVNKAISEMPGSPEEKAAMFLSMNLAAVSSAEKGNSAALIAETFATVPPEALTVISERFAVDLLSRKEGSNAAVNDAQYEKIALETIGKISERCEETDNGSARTTFAILTFLRASGGTPETLMDSLVDMLKNDDAKELARSEWIPHALGQDGREQSYEPLLAAADAGRRPDRLAVLTIAGPQYATALLADLGGKSTERDMFSQARTPVLNAAMNVFGEMGTRIGAEAPGMAGAAGGVIHGGVIEAGGFGDGYRNVRPTPENPDPQGTGRSPISPIPSKPVPPQPVPPQPVPPPYPFQTY